MAKHNLSQLIILNYKRKVKLIFNKKAFLIK